MFGPASLSLLLASASALSIPSGTRTSTPLVPRAQVQIDKVRGVNLGSLFIVEPWMASDEWSKMGCDGQNDEWSCIQNAQDRDGLNGNFSTHWNTFITTDDMAKIKGYGLNTVRIPVGFWIKKDMINEDEHFPVGSDDKPAEAALDAIVGACKANQLNVIIDLHAAPGIQTTGQQFTGHSVETAGFYTQDSYERTYTWLEWMTNKIHTDDKYSTVSTLQVLNEPQSSSANAGNAQSMISNFYPQAYQRIRSKESSLGVQDADQLQIQFMDEDWGSGNPTSSLQNPSKVVFDEHRYLSYDTSIDKTRSGYMSAACGGKTWGDSTIVGEWSIAVDGSAADELKLDADGAKDWYRQFWAAQAASYEKSGGWIFWSFRCNWIGGADDYRWCYDSAVGDGVIPTDASSAASIASGACGGGGS